MMPHSSVLLLILIAYSAYAFGVMIPYKNRTWLGYSYNEDITITCTGTDEVTWTAMFTLKGSYTIKEETPYRKILQIKNATIYHEGTYVCTSIPTKCQSDVDFMEVTLSCDNTCYPNGKYGRYEINPLGSHPAYITPEGSFDEPMKP